MARVSKSAWDKPSLKTKEVEVEELGGTVLVRELPAAYSAELNQYVQLKTIGREQIGSVDLVTMERLKFAYGVVGDDGKPLFSKEEAQIIQANHGRAVKIVLAAIDEISDITAEAQESAEARFQAGGTGTDNGRSTGAVSTPTGGSQPAVPPRAGA